MSTKDRILEAALRLFNAHGIDVITIRHIAKDLEISHSNIQYYFKNADEIIAALYKNHLSILNATTAAVVPDEQNTIQGLHNSIAGILRQIYNYRFIYIHYVVITRRMPAIKLSYQARFVIRRTILLNIFANFREQGIFRNDIPEHIWESLIKNIYVLGDFWISANELTTGLSGEPAIQAYAKQISSLFYPYLTAKGIK